jgi:hypothetical protein
LLLIIARVSNRLIHWLEFVGSHRSDLALCSFFFSGLLDAWLRHNGRCGAHAGGGCRHRGFLHVRTIAGGGRADANDHSDKRQCQPERRSSPRQPQRTFGSLGLLHRADTGFAHDVLRHPRRWLGLRELVELIGRRQHFAQRCQLALAVIALAERVLDAFAHLFVELSVEVLKQVMSAFFAVHQVRGGGGVRGGGERQV